MQQVSKLSKIFLFLTSVSLSLWFGANVTKLFLAYNLFQGYEFGLNPTFASPENLHFILPVISPALLISFIAYVIYLVSFSLFLISSKIKLRFNGWLFIGLVITLVSIPFELYLSLKIDKPFLEMSYWGQHDGKYMLTLIIDRFKLLSSYPIISVLINISLIFLLVFQPLRKTDEN